MIIAVSNIAVNVNPVCTFFKSYETSEPGFAGNIIFCTVCRLTECTSCHPACIVEGVGEAVNGLHAGIHCVIFFVEIIEIRLAVFCSDRLPA